ncbi:MAG: SMP-30/gluconolactonase/LRE family protein [Clostridia bacterium]|nr:SMP-30/gluconolactonase/LRE family protein [Clostridia bacterium]
MTADAMTERGASPLETVRFDARLDALLGDSPMLEKLCSGFRFCEGPVWDARRNLLHFTDFPSLRIWRWSETGGPEIACEDSGREIGLAMDAQGRLLGCASRWQCVSCREPDGSISRLPNRIAGTDTHLNNPNDLAIHSDGCIYLTDPYNPKTCPPRSAPGNGVYRLEPADGSLFPVVDHMERPNGLCFSPDESLLYVNDTTMQFIRVHDVSPDGSLSVGRMFARLDPGFGPGAPDGMKCDRAGNIWVTGPGGIWAIAADGTPLGILRIGESVGNLAWGDADGRSLFVTASSSLYRIRTATAG